MVEGLGEYQLVIGRIVGAYAHQEALRQTDRDDQDLVFQRPLLAYLHPGRFAPVAQSFGFPFPKGFKR